MSGYLSVRFNLSEHMSTKNKLGESSSSVTPPYTQETDDSDSECLNEDTPSMTLLIDRIKFLVGHIQEDLQELDTRILSLQESDLPPLLQEVIGTPIVEKGRS